MNARGAAANEHDLAQPALLKLFWKNNWSFFRINSDINFLPIEPKTVANSGAIIGRAPQL